MIDEGVLDIIKMDTGDMYKVFYSLCDDKQLVDIAKWGGQGSPLHGIELQELINPSNNKKPKNEHIYIDNKKHDKAIIRTEIEARTRVMVKWFINNYGKKSITGDRSNDSNERVGKHGVDLNSIKRKATL
jgi:hypothetical protein